MADILSRQAILAARLRHEDVEVPEWGGTVRVWEVSALRKAEILEESGSTREGAFRLLAACVGDESGPVGMSVDALGSVAERLMPVVMRLNSASVAALEEARKNSEGEPISSSPIGSPPT
jgi:hypothetical protein